MDRLSKIIFKHYEKAIRSRNPYIKYWMSDNLNIWYIKLHSFEGDNGEFIGGEYIVKISITGDFPYKPPSFEILTPNGVYDVGGKICISIGEFHSQNYMPMLGISGFVEQIVSGMIGWSSLGKGIRLLSTTLDEKRALAKSSVQYNKLNYADIDSAVENNYAEYSK